MRARPETMIFHGAVVILLGLLAGFPYASSSRAAWWAPSGPGGWRTSRASERPPRDRGCGGLGPAALDGWKRDVLAWSLVLMAYGNVVASVIGATFAVRGLEPAARPATRSSTCSS